MSADRKRGLPADGGKKPPRKVKSGPKKPRRRRILRVLVRLVVLFVLAIGVLAALFIGTKCYSGKASMANASRPAPDGVTGYARAESFTYLTLPEWYIVFSADEYASQIARRPPSAFPYIGAARQYWGFYGSACQATKGFYPFETGYHVMLGVIGASFTIESTLKLVYENTVGRATEWLSSTDTPEDAFARRVATEYGTFMHTVPWYQFPFASRLAALWKETPLGGPHKVRKLERRLVLTAEYSVKAVYGWVIGQMSGAAYGAEDERIYARIAAAPPAVFKDDRVKLVKPLEGGVQLVTLPRYEAFTRTALAMNALGVRFLDIAGNDDIVITALTRRGMPLEIPDATLLTVRPILTDPTMQRVAFAVPVSSLRPVIEHLARERATVEHLYDY